MSGAETRSNFTAHRDEPGWLATPAGPVFCWYHPPIGARRDLAVLLCDPLGSDRMNLHLAYRHLALALAHKGFAVLRLDYPGSCDSAGAPRDPDRVAAWLAALHAGANYLRQRSDVPGLALFGARFGGTLALAFAAERDDVSHIGVWGAYASGRSFLRSESAFERLSGSNPRQVRPTLWKDGDVEAAGFLFSAQTADALRGLTLGDPARLTGRKVWVAGWDFDKADDTLAEAARASAAEVTSVPGPVAGAASLQRQAVPQALIEQFSQWLSTATTVDPAAGDQAVPGPAMETRLDWEGRPIRERCVRFGPNADLFGILSLPDSDEAVSSPNTAVLLVNGGNNHRVGINRNHVEWARLWAGRGVPVLRFDIRGLGDSPPRRPEDLNRLYLPETVEDLKEAADWLERSLGADTLIVCGLCAGAYQALHFARRDRRVRGLMLLELLRFYTWEPLEIHGPGLRKRLRRLWSKWHPMRAVDRHRIGRWLLTLCRQGTRCLVAYREDEGMIGRFLQEVQPVTQAIEDTGCYQLLKLGSSNHILSPLWIQEVLTRELVAYVEDFRTAEPRNRALN